MAGVEADLWAEIERLRAALAARDATLDMRERELSAALEQRTATSEVLGIISRRDTALQDVLDAIVTRSAALTDSETSALGFIVDGANHLVSSQFMGRIDDRLGITNPSILPDALAPGTVTGELIEQRRPLLHAGGEDAIMVRFPGEAWFWKQLHVAGHPLYGGILAMPLILGDVVYGTLTVLRTSPEPYSAAQVALLEVFARQAVVAIENARLFNELEQRNQDLAESLEQQTASADVLRALAGIT